MYIDGKQDDGTVWIEKGISVRNNSKIQVEVSFKFYSEQESFNVIAKVCAYAGISNAEVEDDFVVLGSANEVVGWKEYTHAQQICSMVLAMKYGLLLELQWDGKLK